MTIPAPIVVPDLDAPGATAMIGEWLVRDGEAVVEGDRLVELLFGEILVELPAPATGTLQRSRRGERRVQPGEVLGSIDPEADA